MSPPSGGFKICAESKEKAWKARGGCQKNGALHHKSKALVYSLKTARVSYADMSLNAPLFTPRPTFLLETGSAITSTCIGLGNSLTPPAGQAGKPVPGYNGKTQTQTKPSGSFFFLSFLNIFGYILIGKIGSFWITQWGKNKKKGSKLGFLWRGFNIFAVQVCPGRINCFWI